MSVWASSMFLAHATSLPCAPAGTNNLQETTDFNYIYQENESDLNAILSQPKDYNHQVIIGGNSDKGHVDSTSIQKNHFIRKDHLKKEFRGECESIDLKKRDANLKFLIDSFKLPIFSHFLIAGAN